MLRYGVTLALALAPTLALAHHTDVVPIRARTDVRVATQVTLFDIEGVSGNFESLTLAGDMLVTQRVAVGAVLPFNVLTTEALGGVAGLGDIGVRGTFQLLDREDLMVAALATIEAPTGDHERALGAGHFEVAAGVGAQLRRGDFAYSAGLGYVQSLAEHERDEVIPVDPHDGRQLEMTVTAAYAPSWYLSATVRADVPVIDHVGAAARFVAGAECGGHREGVNVRFAVAAGLNDDRPFDVQFTFGAEWPFDFQLRR